MMHYRVSQQVLDGKFQCDKIRILKLFRQKIRQIEGGSAVLPI